MNPGTLYVVATPIGNLDDLGARARAVLSAVHLIAAEDTRHSRILLKHYGIDTPMRSCHGHNEERTAAALLAELRSGKDVALISDAGTPLISDPGYRLIGLAVEHGVRVVPVPGPCAPICALSVSALPTRRFAFEGYAPAGAEDRRRRLRELAAETRTLVFLEAPHRIRGMIEDCAEAFGGERRGVIARELTKKFETVRRDTLSRLAEWLAADPGQCRGEFVVIVEGAPEAPRTEAAAARDVLRVLLGYLSVKDAASAAAQLTGRKRNELYELALQLNAEMQSK